MTTLAVTTPSGGEILLEMPDTESACDHAQKTTTTPWLVRDAEGIVVAHGHAKARYQ